MKSYTENFRLNQPGTDPVRRLAPADRLRRFLGDENGAMLIFGVYVFIIILMVSGIGIDFMRYERDRAKLQATLDRAVLAAADLDQPMEPASVVQDYFAKSGLGDFLTSVTVDQGLGYRVVSATASTEIRTQFMHMNGVDTLTVPAFGTAEERIDGVEISLVLDVSGSMNDNNRLPNLVVAAREFVDTMDENSSDGDLSMSIVPYATQVSLPSVLMEQFNVTEEHSYSNCINFEETDFDTAGISYATQYERTMHFDPWYRYDGLARDPKVLLGDNNSSLPVCEALNDREILLFQKDPDVLKTYIGNLTARGNTSIDVGMKWGTALLDPSMRSAIGTLSSQGIVPSEFASLPHDYNDGETLKVIVLMTDGQNTQQYYINDGFREGPSDIFFNDDQNAYSVFSPDVGAYYWPDDNKSYQDKDGEWVDHGDKWADHPFGANHPEGTDQGCIGSSVDNWDCTERAQPGTAANVSYPDLWAHVSIKSNLKDRYYKFMSESEADQKWHNEVRSYVNSGVKNLRTKAICDAAKAQDIIVFTIGFEAPSGGISILKYCASSDAHFFEVNGDVDGKKIRDAFSSIASSIRKLRLTQ